MTIDRRPSKNSCESYLIDFDRQQLSLLTIIGHDYWKWFESLSYIYFQDFFRSHHMLGRAQLAGRPSSRRRRNWRFLVRRLPGGWGLGNHPQYLPYFRSWLPSTCAGVVDQRRTTALFQLRCCNLPRFDVLICCNSLIATYCLDLDLTHNKYDSAMLCAFMMRDVWQRHLLGRFGFGLKCESFYPVWYVLCLVVWWVLLSDLLPLMCAGIIVLL